MKKLIYVYVFSFLSFYFATISARANTNSLAENKTSLTAERSALEAHTLSTRYGVFCIINTTDIFINYQIKIGDNGSWTNYGVSPNYRDWYWHTYSSIDENTSPNTWVRFDSALSAGEDFWTEYRIERYASPNHDCDSGKKYEFRYQGGDRRFIELYSVN